MQSKNDRTLSLIKCKTLLFYTLLIMIAGCEQLDLQGCLDTDFFTPNAPITDAKAGDFIGQWFHVNYLSTLNSSTSAFKAQQTIKGISHIIIEPDYLAQTIFVGSNIHDGMRLQAKFNQADAKVELVQNGTPLAELTLLKSGTDILLSYSHLAQKMQYKFQRLPGHLSDLGAYLNRQFFTGSYSVQSRSPDADVSANLTFLSDGSLIGHKTFRQYRIWYDFYDNVPQLDVVIFKDRRGKNYWYNWLLTPEGLTLRTLTSDDAQARPGALYLRLTPLDR